MSAICHGFVQNAWRKDICSNCFRVRDEHEMINSVRSCANSNLTSGVGMSTQGNNDHYNVSSSSSGVVGGTSSTNGYSNGTSTATNATNNNNTKNNHSTSHTMPHPHSVSINVKSSPTQYMRNARYQSPTLGQSGISGIPRIKTSSSTLNFHSKGPYNNYDARETVKSPVGSNSTCKLRGAASLEVISHIGSSSPNPYGYSNGTSRRHPSKADKESMNNNSLLTSSARSSSSSTLTLLGSSPSATSCSAASGIVRSCAGSGGVGGGGSKENILHYSSTSTFTNNSTLNLNNNTNCASGSSSSACPPNPNANATALTHPPHQFTSNTSTSNISSKRNSTSSAGGCGYILSTNSGGVHSSNSQNSRSTYSVSQQGKNSPNRSHSNVQTPNGSKLVTNPVQMVHVNGMSSNSISARTNSANGVDVKTHLNHSNKTNTGPGARNIPTTTSILGNKSKIMDETDGDVGPTPTGGSSKSKVTFGNNHGNPVDSRNGKSVIVASANTKGILKSKNGNGRRKLTVSFPKEVCEVIGYGGDMNGSSSDEENSDDEDDEPVPDPQDSHSISELLEGNSNTNAEKELNTLTQKNTNFNSIKTNLLGITCIEIGPIVGCTGGKSMENSSKPLVSIGTFESRKEPLKIRKLGDTELPTKGFNSVKSMINNSTTNSTTNAEPKKFIQKNNGVKTSQKVPPSTKNETEPKKSSNDAAKNNVTINGTTNSNYAKLMTNGYTTSSNSNNVNNVQVNGRDIPVTGSTNAISTVHVNAEKTASSAKIATEKLLAKSNDSSSAGLMTNGNDNTTNHNQLNGGLNSQKPAIVLEKPRPKPILKNSQSQIKNSISSSVSNTNTSNNNKTNGTNNSLSNLIIFTDGNNIASKRTSFLKDIINDKEKSLKNSVITNSSCVPQPDEQSIDGQSAISLDKDSLESSQQPRIVKSELKVDLKSGNNNKKHTTTIETNFDVIKSPNDLEFDDSLEDSGLDIKNRTEISESDEKSSSGSDSGNENDFSDRGEQRVNVKIIGASNGSTSPVKGGLFISVDEVGDSVKKPAKLSPDSVLFSSASEMSASGSSESIPDACDKNSPVQAVNVIPIQKRVAPRPPSNLSGAIYANEQPESEEEVYDDVRSFYKNPVEEDLDDEEDLYDDCVAINAAVAATANSGKAVTGSYNFTDGSRTNDVEIDGEEEKVILQHNDGIEFIGIRKIDSETFLRQRSPSPKRERSSSASPKARRKVNQFFSTIGKKAGAAFSSGNHNSNRTKSPSALSNSSSSSSNAAYKRSLSTDEVSMTRTQEIYATLTPTSLKFKGLAPVLQKLSRMDMSSDKDKQKEKDKANNGSCNGDEGDHGKEKIFKKNKISSSIKKFLRFGGKEGESSSSGSNKYDFNNSSFMTKTDNSENLKNSAQFHSACMSTASDESSSIPSCISEESSTAQSESSVSSALVNTPNASNCSNYDSNSSNITSTDNDSTSGRRSAVLGTASPLGRPPPPPPRVHSLDLLNKVGITVAGHGTNGTVRPARPPPPVRSNKVAPSFVSVFSNGADMQANTINSSSSPINNSNPMYANGSSGNSSGSSFNSTDIMTPPNKPKRKASMNGQGTNSRDLENTYNHITSLNLETLKLIASQTPDKIQRRTSQLVKYNTYPLRWSQFYVSELSPMSQGIGYAFYKALWEDEPCVLLVEESMTGVSPFHFECLETSATFEDVVPVEFVTWEASDYVNSGSGVKSFVSVLPPVTAHSIFDYINNSTITAQRKYFALLQAMDFWHQQEMSNLIVLENDSNSSDLYDAIESVLLYVHPVPKHQQKASLHQRQRRPNSSDFEIAMKQLLLNNHNDSILNESDRQVLFRRVSGSVEEVESQLKLFLQLKLFSPKQNSSELEKIRKHRSERAIQQWLDRERALCMNEAVQRSIQRDSQPISPFKKSYLEFLMTPENSAKAVLDMLVDLIL